MFLSGRSLNVLSMMGLMLGVGMLVDNAVVVLESIHRKQRQGYRPVAAAIRGTREVARAITASTLTTVIVFAPIVVSNSDELAVWLGEVGVTISITLALSLLVSLSVIPALSVRMTGRGAAKVENGWIAWLRARYLRSLRWSAIRHPLVTVLLIIPAVLVFTFVMMKATDFKPDTEGDQGLRRENLQLGLDFSDNVDKWRSLEVVEELEAYLESRREDLELRDIYSYYVADGGGISLFFNKGVVSDEFYKSVREDLRDNLPVIAGVKYMFGDEEGAGTGVKSFEVTLFGEDTELLYELSEVAKTQLLAIEGVSDLRSDADGGRKRSSAGRPRASGRFGIDPATISQVMGLTYRGVQLPRLNTGTKEVDMIVSLDPSDRESIENLAILTVGEFSDQPVRLEQVADFQIVESAQRIFRVNRKSGLTIRGSYEGEKLEPALVLIEFLMDQIEMPLGYGWSFGSEIVNAQEQQSEMGMNMLLALICVFFVMASLFESLLHPLVVMACVPFASVGVFWIMMATGSPFNIMAMIGMVILIGIVVNNGIVLVDHVNHRRRQGESMEEALLTACGERMRPILMTAGTTILGLLPLAVFHGAHVGNAEYYPMAWAIIGGLASSTLLTLLVLPTYYLLANTYAAHFGRTLRALRGQRTSISRPDVVEAPVSSTET